MLDRLNILELFGADKNKYHSCIITCYSFDFLFFEQRVLPALRRAGMININVFVDEKMYQHQLANLDGNNVSKQSYSITPIKLNGAFHPKILMGIGKNNGFLAIGSGNLTNSGLSSNDEVWGAFHTYKNESKALPVFQSAFEYLNNLKPFCFAENTKKWDWLLKGSSWLSDLGNSKNINTAYHSNDEVLLLKSFADASIYKQLIANLPNSNLKNITIISPYFNKRGDLITNLIDDLDPDTIDVIIDSKFGTIPHKFIQNKRVKFHEWEFVKGSESNSGTRLHAKIFQFQYEKSTCILTGSANATIEAFGTKVNNSRNAEASVLIKSDESKNWMEELQIIIPSENSFDFGSYNIEKSISNTIDYKSFAYNIHHAELDVTELSVYVSSKEMIPEKSFIVIEKRNDEKSFYEIPTHSSSMIIIELKELEAELGFRVYIANDVLERISSYDKIHNQQLIQRTNPDSKSTKFLEILNGTELGNSDLITLLEFANFKENSNVRISNSSSKVVVDKSIEVDLKEYGTVSEEEFHQNENIIEERHSNASSQLTMLEDFLNNMTFKDVEEDFNDSVERSAEDSKDAGISGSNNVVDAKTVLTFHEGQRIKGIIQKTFKKIYDSIEQNHKDVLDSLVNKVPTEIKVSIKNLQAILVGTHLIFMKLDEKYFEERFRFVIRYKRLEDLLLFEKIKKIKLKRLDEHMGLNSNEVAYSADGNVLKEIETKLLSYKGIELVYCDETSSINIEHSYFSDNPIFSKKVPDLFSLKGFLINTISKLLLLAANEVEDYSSKDLIRFKVFKRRLFYRTLVLYSNLKWSNKELQLAEVFLLNVFYTLLPEDFSVDEVLREYSELRAKTPFESLKGDALLKRTLISFSGWMFTYKNNKTELINLIDRRTIGKIIFKSKIGFAIVISNDKGTLNLKTPLGFFNKVNEEFEIKSVRGGLKAIMYKG
jgi:hypothetical protein